MCTKQPPISSSYLIDSVPLTKLSKHKYLCIILSSNLSWAVHIIPIVAKASCKFWFLKRKMCHCTAVTELTAYKTPILINCLESVWKKALCFVYNLHGRDTSAPSLHEESHLLSLAWCRWIRSLHFFHSVVHGQSILKFANCLTFNDRHTTRQTRINLMREFRWGKQPLSYSVPCTIREWSMLPPHMASIPGSAAFPKAVVDQLSTLK